jgi:hypothetical protein
MPYDFCFAFIILYTSYFLRFDGARAHLDAETSSLRGIRVAGAQELSLEHLVVGYTDEQNRYMHKSVEEKQKKNMKRDCEIVCAMSFTPTPSASSSPLPTPA